MINQDNIVQIQQAASAIISRLDKEISQVRARMQDSQDRLQAGTVQLAEHKKRTEAKETAEQNLANALETVAEIRKMAEKANQGKNRPVVVIDDKNGVIPDLQQTVAEINAEIQRMETYLTLTNIEQEFLNNKRNTDQDVLDRTLASKKELLELTQQLSGAQSAINDLEGKLTSLHNKAMDKQGLCQRKDEIEIELAKIKQDIQAMQVMAEQAMRLFKRPLVNIQDGTGKLALETELKEIEGKIEALSQELTNVDSLKQNLQDAQAELKVIYLKLQEKLKGFEQQPGAVSGIIASKERASVATSVQRDSNGHTSSARTSPNSLATSVFRQSPPVIDLTIGENIKEILRAATALYNSAWGKYANDNNIDHLDAVITHLSSAITTLSHTNKSGRKMERTSSHRDSIMKKEIDLLRQNIVAILGIKLTELYNAKQYSKCMEIMRLIKAHHTEFASCEVTNKNFQTQRMSVGGGNILLFKTVYENIQFYYAKAALQGAISYFQNNNIIIMSANGKISLNPEALNKLLSDNTAVELINEKLQTLEEAYLNYKSLEGHLEYVESISKEPQQCLTMIGLLSHRIGNYFYDKVDFNKLRDATHHDFLSKACFAFNKILKFKEAILATKVLTQDDITPDVTHLNLGEMELSLQQNPPRYSYPSSTSSMRSLTHDFDRQQAASGLAPAVLEKSGSMPPLEDPKAIAAPAADSARSVLGKRKNHDS